MAKAANDESNDRKLGRPFGRSSADTKKRLLEAAAGHFNSNSFGEVSLSKIAKSAGMTGAAIYNHFGSKEALFIATVNDRIQRNLEIISEAASIEGSWKDRLNNVLNFIGKIQKADQGFPLITVVAQTRMVREPDKYADIINLRNEYSKVFQSIVADAVEAGDLPDSIDIPIAGELLMALTANAIQTVSFYHPEPSDTEQIIVAVRALLGIDR